jgi:hypothetical protein
VPAFRRGVSTSCIGVVDTRILRFDSDTSREVVPRLLPDVIRLPRPMGEFPPLTRNGLPRRSVPGVTTYVGSAQMTDTQGSAGYIDLVVMGEIGEPLEDAEQVLVPEAAQDLQIAGAALRAEPGELVATLCAFGNLSGVSTDLARREACQRPSPDVSADQHRQPGRDRSRRRSPRRIARTAPQYLRRSAPRRFRG